jgi:hypothetical protein
MAFMYEPCFCNSGKKFKFCCHENIEKGFGKELEFALTHFPVKHCFINSCWKKRGMASILVVRIMPNDHYVVGLFLVDIWYLGVKDAGLKVSASESDLQSMKFIFAESGLKCISIEYEDVRSIIFGGVQYAKNLDVDPHPDWIRAQCILESSRSFNNKFKFGYKGKPRYVPGPYD